MENAHQNIIISNLKVLVAETNLETLVPELLNRNVFNLYMINRILNPAHGENVQKTDLYLEILKRGPDAFDELQKALISTNHLNLAKILSNNVGAHRSMSVNSYTRLNSVWDEHESDGPCLSRRRKNSAPTLLSNSEHSSSQSQGRLNTELSKSPDIIDFMNRFPNVFDPKSKVFNYPVYTTSSLENYLKSVGLNTPELLEKLVNYLIKRNRPVDVKYASDWKVQIPGFPRPYKMDSMPRGYALVINNKEFDDKNEFPDRVGAENDELRFIQLLKKLHFEVEHHENKTREQIKIIIENFTRKKELKDVDCVWATFMSHGEEGDSQEDSKIMGVDGLGLETDEIIRRFDNASCPVLINKPRILFFQACRGSLTDPGVSPGDTDILNLNNRITTDGKKVTVKIRERTQSDIFVAYSALLGYRANRDIFTGAWFIQEVVDVFSKYAHTTHLDDLLKMVDEELKKLNTFYSPNFQAVTTKTIGWNKLLYFNPGLFRDKTTGATIRIGSPPEIPHTDEGMDVVDTLSENSNKSPDGTNNTKLKNHKDEDSDDQSGGGFHLISSCCKPS